MFPWVRWAETRLQHRRPRNARQLMALLKWTEVCRQEHLYSTAIPTVVSKYRCGSFYGLWVHIRVSSNAQTFSLLLISPNSDFNTQKLAKMQRFPRPTFYEGRQKLTVAPFF